MASTLTQTVWTLRRCNMEKVVDELVAAHGPDDVAWALTLERRLASAVDDFDRIGLMTAAHSRACGRQALVATPSHWAGTTVTEQVQTVLKHFCTAGAACADHSMERALLSLVDPTPGALFDAARVIPDGVQINDRCGCDVGQAVARAMQHPAAAEVADGWSRPARKKRGARTERETPWRPRA
jgi:hypothetical protein